MANYSKAGLATLPSADERRRQRRSLAEATVLLARAKKLLQDAIHDEDLSGEIPVEVQTAVELAVDGIIEAIGLIEGRGGRESRPPSPSVKVAPTRQQGQFLAFIREYIMCNEAGIAPSHADLQRFFGLTPPSVNSMLIRLEHRGFICRVPGKARAIELVIDSEFIPPLDRPLRPWQ